MPILNEDDLFSLQTLTARANDPAIMPPAPSVIANLGIFEEDGVTTTSISVEYSDGKLGIVDRSARGGPGESVSHAGRSMTSFVIPHFQRDDSVLAESIQNIRAFGEENMLETLQGRIDVKMRRHLNDLAFTLEHQRLGAISGQLTDKDGNVYENLFTAFGVSAPSAVDFVLGTASTDIRGKCTEVMDKLSDAIDMEVGDDMRPITALCGTDFFSKLVNHDKVRETYLNWEAAAGLRADARVPFEFGGIRWIRYRTSAKAQAAKGNSPLIPDNGCRFVISGVPELYITRFAPADYEETVNTVGLPYYARAYPMPNGKGRNLEIQMNAISLCTQPKSIIPGTTSN